MKSSSLHAILGAVALSAFSGIASSQTVTNGTFSGPDENVTGIANIWGWNAQGDISTRGVQSLNDQFGANSVSIGAPPGGTLNSTVAVAWYLSNTTDTLSQTITGLVVGDKYTINFDDEVSNRGAATFNGSFSWGVSLGGQKQDSTGIQIPQPWDSSAWVHNSLTFTATAASEVLEFLAQSSVGVAPEPILLLDNVSINQDAVAAVPEPGTYALMFAGLGVMGWLVRGRRAAA